MVSTTPQNKVHLTGLPRKIRDTCADWHSSVGKWQDLKVAGLKKVNEIADLKLNYIYETEHDSQTINTKESQLSLQELAQKMEELQSLHKTMADVVLKMETLDKDLNGIAQLYEYQEKSEILFQTWKPEQFCQCSAELLDMYQKETSVKQTVLENIAHSETKDLLVVYSAMWFHDSYIKTNVKLLLNSMLKESGLM